MTDVTPCPKCGGDKTLEAMHPNWGTRTCPEAYIAVDCPQCDGAGVVTIGEFAMPLLEELEEFLDNQADAEILENGRMMGNDAMRLLEGVQDLMKRINTP